MHQFGVTLSANPAPVILPDLAVNDARWFAIYTNSRHEKSVAKQFAERRIESFLPLYRKVHHWTKHSRVTLELPLFPNYVFAHFAPQRRVPVLAVPGVLGIVGRGHISSALSDAEIESLRTGLELGKFEPHPYLVVGERVRIRAGGHGRDGGHPGSYEEWAAGGPDAGSDPAERGGRGGCRECRARSQPLVLEARA